MLEIKLKIALFSANNVPFFRPEMNEHTIMQIRCDMLLLILISPATNSIELYSIACSACSTPFLSARVFLEIMFLSLLKSSFAIAAVVPKMKDVAVSCTIVLYKSEIIVLKGIERGRNISEPSEVPFCDGKFLTIYNRLRF